MADAWQPSDATRRDPLVRKSVGTLLLEQREAERDLSRVMREHAAEIAARAEQRRKQERDAVILAMLLMGSKRMAAAVKASVISSRQSARVAARRRLTAELKALGIVIAAHQWVVGNRRDADEGYAGHAADSLVSQWRGVAIANVLGSARKDRTAAEAIRKTTGDIGSRIVRTSHTEVTKAYSDEHAEALMDVVDYDRKRRDGELADALETSAARMWSAMADACERCWPLDGTVVGLLESFPGGAEPGDMHPRCRCVEVLVSRNATAHEEAA